MSEFLLEIYSEEIPARMQKKAANDLAQIFLDFCQKEEIKISDKQIKSFITSRRITLFIDKIDKFQISPAIQKIGPKTDANSKAIEGFSKSIGVKNIKDLEIITNNKGQYYAYNQKEGKINTVDILSKNLPMILQKMSNMWPKNMRWQDDKNQSRWVRPIRSILAIFDGNIVNFEFVNIKSSNSTFGHKLLMSQALQIANFEDYKTKLEKNFVILDQEKRREIIIEEINKICQKQEIELVDKLNEDNKLLDEVVGLAEFPSVGVGKIEEGFMSLPKEVLTLTAKLHQKYFCTKQGKKLAPYFIFVSNVKVNKQIILDNQKVLRARLSDAKFFIDEDLKTPLIDRRQNLKDIIFHEKLGTIYDKTKRLEALTKFMAFWIPNTDITLSEKLPYLAKNDLTTKCVAELPELQGIVGGYYAKMQGENNLLSKAIWEQYLPVGPNSEIPQTPLGSLLALCDKIDSITGLFLVNQKPTSSKDPLALRRAALGVLRIIIHNNLSLPLRIIVEKSINSFPIKILRKSYPGRSNKEIKKIKSKILFEIIEFIIERIKSVLKDHFNVRSDICNVLTDNYFNQIQKDRKFDINKLVKKAVFINNFVNNKSNSKIIELYKRVVNIVNIEERKDKKTYDSKPHFLSMRDKNERLLYKVTKSIAPKIRKAGKVGDYEQIFELFLELETPLNNFFDNVQVNVKQDNIRENRLLILGKIKNLFNAIFDFSRIEK